MNEKALPWGLMALLTISLLSLPVSARDMSRPPGSAMDSVSELEATLWGTPREGSAVDRTAALEATLLGQAEQGPVLNRIARLREYLMPGSLAALPTRVSALELALFKRISAEPLVGRLAAVEKSLLGQPGSGTYLARMDADLKAVGLDGYKAAAQVIPADTPVAIRLLSGIRTDQSPPGEPVGLEVVRNVLVDGVTVIAAGARGTAHVVGVRPAKRFGRNGRLELEFCAVTAVDGQLLYLGSKASLFTLPSPDRSTAYAVGAGAAGFAMIGMPGVAAAALVTGREVNLPAGKEFELFTAKSASVTVYRP